MFNIDIGTILLFATLLLLLLDVILVLLNSRIQNWLYYDHIILYVATITLFASFMEFLLNLIFQDWSYAYVTGYSSVQMDIPLRIASSWSGAAGSFYLWTMFMFSGFIIFRFIFRKMMDQAIYQYASIIQGINLIAFISFILLKAPFAKNAVAESNGIGLNPLLSTFLNLIHPPIIFLGYSIFVIAFSLALAKIITELTDKEAPAELQKFMRLTMAMGWLVLGTGILIGGYWAYTSLGWGGFWAWDPVETGSLIPWLFALVFFHGSPVFRSDKGNFGKDILATFPFLSVLFATIVTRTGALTSVHSFSAGPSDYILIMYLLLVLLIEALFILHLYRKEKIKFFYSMKELESLKRQDAALYISFFAFFLGTLAICFGQVIPFIFYYLPGAYSNITWFNSLRLLTIGVLPITGANLIIIVTIVLLALIGYMIQSNSKTARLHLSYFITEKKFTRDEVILNSALLGASILVLVFIFDLFFPTFYNLLPFGMGGAFTVDKRFFNIIIGVFGFAALEAAFFTDFVFIKTDKNKAIAIAIGVNLGLLNVILNLPLINFLLQTSNIGILFQVWHFWFISFSFYSLLHILGTTSILANFIIPILILSFVVLIITIYKFLVSKEMQKQVKMRKISQTLLHLGIVIALIGALFSYNSTYITELDLSPIQPSQTQITNKLPTQGPITTANNIKLSALNYNYTPFGTDFQDKLTVQVHLLDSNGKVIGSGVLDYTNYNIFGLIVNTLIISSVYNDIYITVLTYTANANTGIVSDIQFEVRIIPMINFLWLGAGLVMFSMLALVVISFKLFVYSYKKAHKEIHANSESLLVKSQLTA